MKLTILNIKNRLLLLSVVPLLILITFSAMILNHEIEHKHRLVGSHERVQGFDAITKVIHSMQIERALSISFIYSSIQVDTKLQSIRNEVDRNLDLLGVYRSSDDKIAKALDELKSLSNIRANINKKELTDTKIKEYYSAKITLLLDIIHDFQRNIVDADDATYLQLYWHLANAKESLGLLRASINKYLREKHLDDDTFFWIIVSKGSYDKNIHNFLNIANETTKSLYQNVFSDEEVKQTFALIDTILKSKNIQKIEIDPEYWFDISTKSIDKLREIEDATFALFDASLKNKILKVDRDINITMMLLVVAIGFIVVIVAMFSRRVFDLASKLEQKYSETELLLEQYKMSVDESAIVSKTDPKGRIIYVNSEFCKVSGFSKEELLGKPHNIVRHPDMPKELFKEMWHTIKTLKKPWMGEVKNRTKNGSYYWVRAYVAPLLDKDGNVVEYIGLRTEITELVKQREALQRIAYSDSLSGLYNRLKLSEDIKALDNNLSLAIINIDSFRELNDVYGHSFGDKIIIECAKIIKMYISNEEYCSLYRLQGDEFALLSTKQNSDLFTHKIMAILYHIKSSQIIIDDESVLISCSAGISYDSKEFLLNHANMALKIAKLESKDLVVYSDDNSLNAKYNNNIKYAKKLTQALKDNKVVAYFQAIVDNNTKEFNKYEALVRIIDEDGSVISPFFFLDVAKKSKKYFGISRAVLIQAFEKFKDTSSEVSINLSILDITDAKMVGFIINLLKENEMGHRITFEIVESEYIDKFDEALSFITEVKKYGAKIAIDDFGTGYSNFEYLLKLKADYLKIDGSLIKNITRDENSYKVVSAIVDFTKKLGMKTVAEFVEDEEIFNVVKELGIDYSQGYYFDKPSPNLKH